MLSSKHISTCCFPACELFVRAPCFIRNICILAAAVSHRLIHKIHTAGDGRQHGVKLSADKENITTSRDTLSAEQFSARLNHMKKTRL